MASVSALCLLVHLHDVECLEAEQSAIHSSLRRRQQAAAQLASVSALCLLVHLHSVECVAAEQSAIHGSLG